MELTNSAPAPATSPFSAVFTMFYEPALTFAALEPKKSAWLPLMLLMLSSAVLMTWYFNIVDFSWLVDQMLSTIKEADKREAIRGAMSKSMMMGSALGATLVGLPIIMAITGAYLMIAGKVASKEFTFGSGFALAAWASVPALLALPLGALQIVLASGGQISYSDLNPLSLNTLFFHHPMGHPLTGLLDSISVGSLWQAFLFIIGFQVWAKVPRGTALAVVLVPYAVIYAGWAAFALSQMK